MPDLGVQPAAAAAMSGRWMLRHARRMRNDPAGFLSECAGPLGPVVELPVPRQRVFLLNDADAVQRVLQGNHRNYLKRTLQYRSLSLVTGDGLLVSDGEDWRRGRRLVQPAFHDGALQGVGAQVASATEELAHRWDALLDEVRPGVDVEVDVEGAMMRVSLDVVSRSLFAADLGPDPSRIGAAVGHALDAVIARARSAVPMPLRWPTPGNRRLTGAVGILDDAVAGLLEARAGARPAAHEHSPDVLDLLMASAEPGQVRDEVVTLLVAGHETVASVLTWALWLVSGDERVAERMAAEADRVLFGRPPSFADYAELPYTRQVLDEVLRLYPPAWVVTRRAIGADELAGHRLPPGALVVMSPYAMQRNPEYWVDPGRFDPDRFGADDPAGNPPPLPVAGSGPVPRGAYLPFGAGPRLCIGRAFALVEGVLVLAALAGRYRLTRSPGQQVALDAAVTLRPRGGLSLRLAGRRPGVARLPSGR